MGSVIRVILFRNKSLEPIDEPINITDNEKEIYLMLCDDPYMTLDKLTVKSLNEKGLISRKGSNKKGKWTILKKGEVRYDQ